MKQSTSTSCKLLRAVQGGAAAQTDAADAITNMRVIDAIYQAAGLQPRGLSVVDSSEQDAT